MCAHALCFISLTGEKFFSNWKNIFLQLGSFLFPTAQSPSGKLYPWENHYGAHESDFSNQSDRPKCEPGAVLQSRGAQPLAFARGARLRLAAILLQFAEAVSLRRWPPSNPLRVYPCGDGLPPIRWGRILAATVSLQSAGGVSLRRRSPSNPLRVYPCGDGLPPIR